MLPEGIPVVRVTGRFLTPAGKPLTGQVVFRSPMLVFSDFDVILGGPVTVQLDAQGAFAVTLPATDAPGMNPSGWAYSIAEQLAGVTMNRVYQVLLPAETPHVDIADIAPTDPTTPNYVAVRGDSAYEIAVKQGFEGTVEQWLASLVGAQGVKGDQGNTGPAGDSAYEVALDSGFTGTAEQWLASLVGPKGDRGDPGPTGADGADGSNGADGAPGLVQSVNGISEADVVLDAAAVHAVPDTAPGAPNGVAQLDASGKVPAAQLPEGMGGGAVTTVNGKSPNSSGNVALVAADVGALATTARGTANGVAGLDSTGRIPVAQAPATAPRNMWTPQALGFAAWSLDPGGVANPVAKYLTPQRLYLTGFNITEDTTVTKAVLFARGYGGVTSNRYMAGIYRENGTRVVASSAVALTMAGQETGSLPAMVSNHIGAVPLTFASTTLTPGRYWVAWLMTTGGASDFSFFHVQNEAPVATANFAMGTSFFPRAWYISAQSTLPTTVNPAASTALADHDIPILALAA
ncbi:collagen-like protein [Streptomyces shenzhenensis]|uniref:Collagen-like protein n=1 Tax=Streptomyces shenzhenensis TaxID=943815 RepID=A0A3M0IBN1_9ACTN|nr:collagen-like protein [Streptomyces shenzhenensis]RMB83639.1 hypothetical protein CTZ28_23260 [Streptomyces shenzhenensis]